MCLVGDGETGEALARRVSHEWRRYEVLDGDTVALRRLLKANINVDAADYDKRCAVHIACAEGNLVALKVLVEAGADLTVLDRWNNTGMDEDPSYCANGFTCLRCRFDLTIVVECVVVPIDMESHVD